MEGCFNCESRVIDMAFKIFNTMSRQKELLEPIDGKKVQIYSPYYGMGANQNKGICFVADSDWLNIDGLKVDKTNTKIQVKEHRGYEPFTLARFNTTYIGGTIHELGHGLSLPHNLATKLESSNGTALMGAGNYTYRQEWREEGKQRRSYGPARS